MTLSYSLVMWLRKRENLIIDRIRQWITTIILLNSYLSSQPYEMNLQWDEFSLEQVWEKGISITSTQQLYLKTETEYSSCECWEPFHPGGLLVSCSASGRAFPADRGRWSCPSSHPQWGHIQSAVSSCGFLSTREISYWWGSSRCL